jgi:PEGA domain
MFEGSMLGPFRSIFVCRQLSVACLRAALLAMPALTVALCAGTAAAQDKKELSKARAQFQRAIELERAGNYSTALEQFRDVGQVRMTPQVRFHIASCEEKLGRLVTALGGYQLAFADADSVGEDFKAEVDAAVTRLEASIPKLVIVRGTGAEAAEIQLDGVALGASSVGVPVPLDPGPHSISAKAPGALPFSQTVTIAENEQKSVDVALTPEPQEERPRAGAGAADAVDKTNPRLIPYVIGGVGIASLIGSGVLFALRQSTLSDLEQQCGPNHDACPSSAAGDYSNLKLYNVTSQIALGVGLVGVGTAVTMLVLQQKPAPPAKSGMTLLPSAPNSLAGVSWAARF